MQKYYYSKIKVIYHFFTLTENILPMWWVGITCNCLCRNGSQSITLVSSEPEAKCLQKKVVFIRIVSLDHFLNSTYFPSGVHWRQLTQPWWPSNSYSNPNLFIKLSVNWECCLKNFEASALFSLYCNSFRISRLFFHFLSLLSI